MEYKSLIKVLHSKASGCHGSDDQQFLDWTKLWMPSMCGSNKSLCITPAMVKLLFLCPKLKQCLQHTMVHLLPASYREHIAINVENARIEQRKRRQQNENWNLKDFNGELEEAINQNCKTQNELHVKSVQVKELLTTELQLSYHKTFLETLVETQQKEVQSLQQYCKELNSLQRCKQMPDSEDQLEDKLAFVMEKLCSIQRKAILDQDYAIVSKSSEADVLHIVNEALEGYTIHDIVKAVTSFSQRNVHFLDEQMDNKQKSDDLSFQKKLTVLESVKKLLIQMCGHHVQNRGMYEVLMKESLPIKNVSQELQMGVQNAIQEYSANHDVRRLLASYLEKFKEKTKYEAELKTLRQISNHLSSRSTVEKQKTNQLISIQKRIEQNKKKSETLRKSLEVLAKVSTKRLMELEDSSQQMKIDADDALASLTFPYSLESVTAELSTCLKLRAVKLQEYCNQPAYRNLGNILGLTNPDLEISVSRLKQLIHMNPTLTDIFESKKTEKDYQMELVKIEELLNKTIEKKMADNYQFSTKYIESVHLKTKEFDRKLHEQTVPLLGICEQTLSEALIKLSEAKQAVDVWWNQPVKDVADEIL